MKHINFQGLQGQNKKQKPHSSGKKKNTLNSRLRPKKKYYACAWPQNRRKGFYNEEMAENTNAN